MTTDRDMLDALARAEDAQEMRPVFAMAAMLGMLAHRGAQLPAPIVAQKAREYADALIEELSK